MRARAVELHVNMSQEPLYTDVFTGKNAAPQNLGPNFVRACAIKMHVNISQHFTRATLYGFLNRKNAEPQNRGADFVRSCAVEMHINISQEPRKNAAPQKRDPPFVRAWAVDMHVNIPQKPLYAKFTGKKLVPRVSTLIKHRPLHLP